jgi:hypothetical protein
MKTESNLAIVKKINKETLFELMEQDSTVEVSCRPMKHDYKWTTIAVEHENKLWLVGYCSSYNNGIEDDKFEMVEAEKFEQVTVGYREKLN